MSTKENTFISTGEVFQDEKGIYFLKRETKPPRAIIGKVRPEELHYNKKETWEIFVFKKIQTAELEDETIYYKMLLTFEVPDEQRYKTTFLYKVNDGKIFVIDFASGCGSECSINDPEFCTRGKAIKCPENTIIFKGSPIFEMQNGELHRVISENDIW